MAFDAHKNFAISDVATAPSPAASGTSLVVTAGQGTRFPAVPFNATVWPASAVPTPVNSEIVRVTGIATDTLTITRAQETGAGGPSARTIVVGDQIAATITVKTLEDVERQGLRQTFRGLNLRTHPDADVAASKVYLDHADEIVMHDGEQVDDWDDLVADITASGAGGLDTGAEGASRWYEIHAIRKSSDGTKGLLLHRAKDYLLDTSFTTARNAERRLRIATATATDKLAQGVQFATAGKLEFIDVQIIGGTAPTGNIWFSLQASSGGDADGVALATTDKLNAAFVATTANQWVRFVFRAPYTVASATQYHLVLEGDYAKSDTVGILWEGVAAGGYASGVAREYNGTAWANASGVGDFLFKAYVAENDTAVTMPSGYDQRCLVSWAYNNSSSDFDGFIARDRVVTFKDAHTLIVGGTATIVTLLDASAALPPVPSRIAQLQLSATVTGTVVRLTGVFGGTANLFGGVNYTAPGTGAFYWASNTLSEYQHLYYTVDANAGSLDVFAFDW